MSERTAVGYVKDRWVESMEPREEPPMGHMKDLYIAIYNGGDEAVAAVERMGKDWREQLEQAASEIERRWIPVKERLPERRMRVLVVMSGGVVWGGCYRPDTKKKFVLDGSDTFQRMNFLKSITHWMPLPEPPV